MIRIVFFEQDGVYYGFEEKGHAGFDEAGHDVVCAAVSAMTMLLINTVEVSYGSNVDYTIDEATTDITVIAKEALPAYARDDMHQFAISGLFQSYFLQLNDMLDDYYEYLDVSVEKRPVTDKH